MRRPSDGSQPSTDHSRYELEPQDQVAGGRWLLHVGGSRGLLPGLESATAKISGSGRSGVPPNMSTWRLPSGVARGAAQPEHDMARPALQHHPTHGARARSARRCRKTHTCTNTKVVRQAKIGENDQNAREENAFLYRCANGFATTSSPPEHVLASWITRGLRGLAS